MARNVEIKARVDDAGALAARAAALSDTPVQILRQRDRFFASSDGRLKLRWIDTDGASHAELIHYHRPHQSGPKLADYRRVAVSDPEGLASILDAVLGGLGEVVKTRRLYRRGQTRIHLDTVAGLGEFLELEVVLTDQQSPAEGQDIARALMELLGVAAENLLEGAYLDLLQGRDRDTGL